MAGNPVSTLDEHINQALNRALDSLHRHLEADLTTLTRDMLAAAEAASGEAAAQAADAATAEARRQTELQMDEAARVAQSRADDAIRAADMESGNLRQRIVALEIELGLAHDQARVDLERAQKEIDALTQQSQSLAEDVVIEPFAEAEGAVQPHSSAELDRVRTDAQQAELSATAALVNGIRSIDGALSLGDVLTALQESAAHECERAGVLIVKGETLRGWRFSGFTPAMTSQPGAVLVAGDEAGLAGSVAATGASNTRSPALSTDDRALPAFARGAGARHAVAMPISVGGKVVAVLYGDAVRADIPSAACRWPSILEVFVRHASRALEALTVQQAAGLAPALRATPVARRPLPGPVEDSGGTGDGDAARRLARLLVSEIRMFHEPVVDAARRTRDLRTRLGGEIDRARRLYEERIPAAVRQAADYFEQELVRTLADGDGTLLE